MFDPTLPAAGKKRLVVCCDGTWMNSDTGYDKTSRSLQTPSNVTRLSRALKRQCKDGRVQIIEYQNGVGTGSTVADAITGGAFGKGIADHIREAYSFICANYEDGDEIVLVGFSRGAFTARSIAGMIGDLGLLTRKGMEFFYPIFKDMQNWRTPQYKDPFPRMPFENKPRGENAEEAYREMLLSKGLTRVHENGGKGPLIRVTAVGVWDTVGSLGVPRTSWMETLGIRHVTREHRFYDTNLSDRIGHAFQALALDEHRPPFAPTVWERKAENKFTTDLRQVWFPGNHGNVGGGWSDEGIANMSLAWMMDQLASIGVEFDEATIDRIFTRTRQFYSELAGVDPNAGRRLLDIGSFMSKLFGGRALPWAVGPIYEKNAPVRPWGLGAILQAGGWLYKLAGHDIRTPGMYHKVDPLYGRKLPAYLEDTNERIHSSVRVRLAVKGLGLNDKGHWDAPALLGNWRLAKTNEKFDDPIPRGSKLWGQWQTTNGVIPKRRSTAPTPAVSTLAEDGTLLSPPGQDGEGQDDDDNDVVALPSADGSRWIWEYCGPESQAPPERIMVEEPLGPYERHLLKLSGGQPNIFVFAETGSVETR